MNLMLLYDRYKRMGSMLFAVISTLTLMAFAEEHAMSQTQLTDLPSVEFLYRGDLFTTNPAALSIQQKPLQAGVSRKSYESKWLQDQLNSANITNESSSDIIKAGFYLDAGAGMGIGISHQRGFNKVQTSLDDENLDEDRLEFERSDTTMARILIELTDELRAGMQLQFTQVQKDVLGHLFLNSDERVDYTIPFMGYGFGAIYQASKFSVGYTYLPPLRGKANIGGEELIGVFPGTIQVDLTYFGNTAFQIGLLGRKWLHDKDDRDDGTTAEDDSTSISLYGLDIEQYIEPRQQLALLGSYKVNQAFSLYGALGSEKAEFVFYKKFRYSQLDIGNNRNEKQYVRKYHALVGANYIMNQYEISGGLHFGKAGADYNASDGTIKYNHSGNGFEAAIRFKI